MEMQFHATTICAVRHNGKGAIAGDGQVTFGNSMVMKHHSQEGSSIISAVKSLPDLQAQWLMRLRCLRNLKASLRSIMAICSGQLLSSRKIGVPTVCCASWKP